MADYTLTQTEAVRRNEDGACIPNDPANRDWVEYQAWLDAGGVPDPYVEPPFVPPPPSVQTEVMFDHENRLRVMEGEPVISIDEFRKKRGL